MRTFGSPCIRVVCNTRSPCGAQATEGGSPLERISEVTYFQLGAYQLRIDLLRALFPDGEDRPPRLKDERAQAWTLCLLGNSYSLSGQPRRAAV